MYKAVSYGGTVLHFYHKAHKPSLHMPLDQPFAAYGLVQIWLSFWKVAFPCRRKKAVIRRIIHMQLLGHVPANSHYGLL